jgi:hypothetical protein
MPQTGESIGKHILQRDEYRLVEFNIILHWASQRETVSVYEKQWFNDVKIYGGWLPRESSVRDEMKIVIGQVYHSKEIGRKIWKAYRDKGWVVLPS